MLIKIINAEAAKRKMVFIRDLTSKQWTWKKIEIISKNARFVTPSRKTFRNKEDCIENARLNGYGRREMFREVVVIG